MVFSVDKNSLKCILSLPVGNMKRKPKLLEAKQLETVLRISQAVSRTLDLEEILQLASRMTTQALKADRCSIGLLGSKETYRIVHTYRKKRSYPSIDGVEYDLKNFPHISTPLLKRKVVHLHNHKKISLSSKEKELFRHLDMKVFLAVPIIVDQKPLGAFHLARVENSYPFTTADIYLCQTIANQVGIAIRNANLLRDLKDRYDQQNVILNISKSLFQTLNLQKLFNLITRKTCEALKMDRCTISTFEPGGKQGVIRSIYLSRKAGSFGSVKHNSTYLGVKYRISDFPYIFKLLQKKKVFVAEDILSTPLTPVALRYCRNIGMKSSLILPFFSEGKMSGILQVSSIKDYHLFTDSEIKLCQTIANLASLAIENAKLMQDLQEKNVKIKQQTETLTKQFNEQSILLDISEALSQTLDLKQLFKIVTKKTAELMGIDRCVVMLFDKKKKKILSYILFSKGTHKSEPKPPSERIEDFPEMLKQVRSKHIFCASDVSISAISRKEKRYFKKLGVKSVLDVPFILANEIHGILAINTLDEYRGFTESEISLAQAIANQLSIAIENANLMLDLQEKSEKIQRQAEDLEKKFKEESILLEISKALSQTLEFKKLFEIVVKKTSDLLGIDRCAVILLDEVQKASSYYKVYSDGKHRPEYEGVKRKFEDYPKLIQQLKQKHIFCTSDVSRSVLSSVEKKAFVKEGIKSLLVIPFFLADRVLGLLALSTLKDRHSFTESEIKLTQAIANQLSMAIENARLMELAENHARELEKLARRIINAQEEEKKNIAGKLHDVIAQDLTALRFDLKMCQQSLPQEHSQIKERLRESEELVRQSLEDLRNLTSDLRPQVLDHFGLPSAIQWYVDNFRRRTNLRIDLKIPEFSCKFPPEFETTVYRIIQEGLTNVAKHSQATRASISFYKKENLARIIIKDNGIGFDPESPHLTRGLGLLRLKENTELLGGKFKINSKKGKGTKLNITLPC